MTTDEEKIAIQNDMQRLEALKEIIAAQDKLIAAQYDLIETLKTLTKTTDRPFTDPYPNRCGG